MKKLLLGLSMLATSLAANATHLMGGEITAKRLQNGQYKLTLTYYRDTLGVPLSTTENVDIFATSGIGGGGSALYLQGVTLKFDTLASQSLVQNFPYGVQTGVYTKGSLSLGGGFYRIISNTCCRNGAILNAANPLSESLVLYTDLSVSSIANSTPNFLAMPIAHFAVNTTTTYNPMPYDVDGDSIAWDYHTPIGGYANGAQALTNVAGFAALNTIFAYSMNPTTGEITWTPTNTGNFIQSFAVNEYRNGVLTGTIIRDMQYVVLPYDSSNPPPSFSMITPYNTNTQNGYYYNYYTPGQQYVFSIKGTSPSASALLTMSSFGEPYQMANPGSFVVTGNGNEITGTFAWTPPANLTRDIMVSFRLGNGIFTKDFTLLLRKNANTKVAAINTINSFSVFPNPAQKELNIVAELSSTATGVIALYNTLGQQVQVLYDGAFSKGKLHVTAPLTVAPGTYFVVAKASNGTYKTTSVVVQ